MSSEIVYVAPRDPVQYRPGVPRGVRGGSLKDDREGTHAREIELKRSRGEISCAECRRYACRVSISDRGGLTALYVDSRSSATDSFPVPAASVEDVRHSVQMVRFISPLAQCPH